MELRDMIQADFQAEQRETDRCYANRGQSFRKPKLPTGCENFFKGCKCDACNELTEYWNYEE